MDSHNLEPQEYTDRVKMYSQKLSQQWSNVRHPNVPGPKGLLADIPSEAVLRKPAFTQADLQMVSGFVLIEMTEIPTATAITLYRSRTLFKRQRLP